MIDRILSGIALAVLAPVAGAVIAAALVWSAAGILHEIAGRIIGRNLK